jgi:hypothetical protein
MAYGWWPRAPPSVLSWIYASGLSLSMHDIGGVEEGYMSHQSNDRAALGARPLQYAGHIKVTARVSDGGGTHQTIPFS